MLNPKFFTNISARLLNNSLKKRYFRSKENHGYIFFPTLYSLMARLELAVEMKTGVAIWELGQGLNYFMDIL